MLRLCSSSLIDLDLSHTDISTFQTDILLSNVESLNLEGCRKLTDDGFLGLLRACSKSLRLLYVTNAKITGENVNVELPNLTTLMLLYLDELTNTGLANILRHCPREAEKEFSLIFLSFQN